MSWPLNGRSEEMRTIEAAILASDASGIVVYGPAGVGKSRIAREALSSAASRGCEVRWIVGTSSARAIPLGALSSWIRPAVNDSLELIRDAIASLTSSSPGKTVVLGVDDVALLDDISQIQRVAAGQRPQPLGGLRVQRAAQGCRDERG